jgi:hypothetical protein
MDGWMDAGVQLAVILQNSSPVFFAKLQLAVISQNSSPVFFAELQLAVISQNSSLFFCRTAACGYFAKQRFIKKEYLI